MRLVTSARGGTRKILSKGEKRLLNVIAASKGGESILELCRKAKVNNRLYYRMISDPEFGSMLPEALDYLLGQQLIPVVSMVVQRALAGSAKHAELLFKLSGLIGGEEATKILQVFGNGENVEGLMPSDVIRKYVGLLK